jgi:hypothetical protein
MLGVEGGSRTRALGGDRARRLSAVVGELRVVRLARPEGEALEPAGSLFLRDPELVALLRKPLIEGPIRG